ncbi:hypothetical protein BOX15_Mlig009573g1 [Macrostomum lignano]|uniref:Histone-lysine N-methyltransferase SETMAR n=1 Tax=Macrostomum lignano TaxID=282301 RepID=A0A267DXJ0_9PLAT|nr:hypothetical protein BOX15_Mlig009573g1 [Macrostomum lignano]
MAQRTAEAISKLKFMVLPHPPYSRDLAPADFALFPELKRHLKGRVYDHRDQIEEEVLLHIIPDSCTQKTSTACSPDGPSASTQLATTLRRLLYPPRTSDRETSVHFIHHVFRFLSFTVGILGFEFLVSSRVTLDCILCCKF